MAETAILALCMLGVTHKIQCFYKHSTAVYLKNILITTAFVKLYEAIDVLTSYY